MHYRALIGAVLLTTIGCSHICSSKYPCDVRPKLYKTAEKQQARDDARTTAAFAAARSKQTSSPCAVTTITALPPNDPCAIATPLGQIRGGVFTLTNTDIPWWVRLYIRVAAKLDGGR